MGIVRLKHKANLGNNAEEVRFVILILCPSDVKVTKTALETGRTFATVFSDLNLRYNLMIANTVTEFKTHILVTSNEFANHQAKPDITLVNETLSKDKDELKTLSSEIFPVYSYTQSSYFKPSSKIYTKSLHRVFAQREFT